MGMMQVMDSKDTQAIVAPLPAFLVTAANGMVFGRFWGVLISWIGALMGALTSFYIARLFGNMALIKIVRNQKTVEFIRHAGEKKGVLCYSSIQIAAFYFL
jgi:uncharacterized membrane protein YdjX (TVP38/TMEM64 family)